MAQKQCLCGKAQTSEKLSHIPLVLNPSCYMYVLGKVLPKSHVWWQLLFYIQSSPPSLLDFLLTMQTLWSKQSLIYKQIWLFQYFMRLFFFFPIPYEVFPDFMMSSNKEVHTTLSLPNVTQQCKAQMQQRQSMQQKEAQKPHAKTAGASLQVKHH